MGGEMSKLEVRNKKAYSEQLRIGATFYSHLLRTFIACISIGIITCGYLWFWLYRYEKQSVNGAMLQYVNDVYNHHWDKIYYDDARYFQELNNKDAVTQFLLYTMEQTDMKPGGCTFVWIEGDDVTQYYDVYYRQSKIFTLETTKPENSNVWKVRALIGAQNYDFETLEGSTFRINDIPITDRFSHELQLVPGGFRGYDLDPLLPTVTCYHVRNLVGEPAITLENEDDIAVRDHSAYRYYIGPKPTPEQYSDFANLINDTAMAYCQYITEDGTLYDLKQHLLPGTVFYDAVNSFDNQWFSTHESIAYQNIEISDVLPLGENAFVGCIKFDYVVTAANVTQTYSNFYQMYFIKDSNDEWKCINIYTVSDSGSNDNESLPQIETETEETQGESE